MSIVKFDLEAAEWLVDNKKIGKSVQLYECEKCGALFMPELGHDCDNVIEVTAHETDEEG